MSLPIGFGSSLAVEGDVALGVFSSNLASINNPLLQYRDRTQAELRLNRLQSSTHLLKIIVGDREIE